MNLRAAIRRMFSPEPKKAPVDAQQIIGRLRAKLQQARYDAAGYSDEYKNIWANADRYDADSANSREVRHTLISRLRYEIGSNGYSDGIAQTYSTDLIGVSPTLRMQTGSQPFNQMIENRWYLWTKAVHFRRKLWCMAHAKHSDGEAFAVMRRNPRVNHPIKLDLVLYEAEQCQTPFIPFGEKGYIDGIKFDEFGNPLWYDILQQHPGTANGLMLDLKPERVPADMVLHWFKMRRPGQHRGVPECASTLNTGAAARRWREATLAAAETAAEFTAVLKTAFPPETVDQVDPMELLDIHKRMMVALPNGWDVTQMRAEHPSANYEAFHKTLINEQARCKNMPYNKAACDSSSYNYASGRLDHQTYYAALDVEREDCNELVLDPLFDRWFDLAIANYGWLGGDPAAIGPGARVHLWDWPKHRVADVESEANANRTKLESGQVFPHQIFTDAGLDPDDEVEKAAEFYQVDPSEVRRRIFDAILPPAKAAPQVTTEASVEKAAQAALQTLMRRNAVPKANGNGVHHEN